MSENVITRQGKAIEAPSILTRLFTDVRFAILWLPIRVWLGMQWVEAGLHKLSDPAWMKTGVALKGFWTGAIQVPAEGRPPIAYAWYREFLEAALNAQAYTWFAKVVAVGELLIGIALILGIFVGLTAFFAGFMNWNFIMAGSVQGRPWKLLLIKTGNISAKDLSALIGRHLPTIERVLQTQHWSKWIDRPSLL